MDLRVITPWTFPPPSAFNDCKEGALKIVPCLLACIWALPAPAHAAPMTKEERQHLVAHLEMTAIWMESELAHLSKEQLQYRPAPDRWSVIDVLTHLNLAEPIYWRQLSDALKAAPSTEKPQVTDDDVLWYGVDRTTRQKTSPNKVPQGPPPDLKTSLAAFRKLHAEILEYARTTDDDLRAHLVPKEGTDAYQWVLMISTHAQRHILQIREIKASAGFPAK